MNKLIVSKTYQENYLGYLLIEIIMVAIFTFLSIALIAFYFIGKIDSKKKTNVLQYILDHLWIYGLICILPTILAIATLLYLRNRNYIVAYLFDHSTNQLHLKYRGIMYKTCFDICIPFAELNSYFFCEKKVLFNQIYKGRRLTSIGKNLRLDFVTNNFIWEEQIRDKVYFLEQLNKIKKEI